MKKLPREVQSRAKIIDQQIHNLDKVILWTKGGGGSNIPSEDEMQSIASNFVFVAAAVFVERGVQSILNEYVARRSSRQVSKFTSLKIGRFTTLNRSKISELLAQFDSTWRDKFESDILEEYKNSVDNIKTNRDRVAHGDSNRVGYVEAKEHYGNSKHLLIGLRKIVG